MQSYKDNKEIVWRPTYKQELFLSLPWGVKEGFYAGSAGAGKSDVLLLYPIINRWHEHPKFKGLFLRRTFPELKNEIIPRSRDYYSAVGGKYNKNDKTWEFPSGALIFFGHCEAEDDVHNYDSMQPNYVAFDELTSFSEWQYTYITFERVRRTIDVGNELPAIVRSGSNPGNIGHAWVKKRFIDPYPDGLKILRGKGGNKRIFIPATLADNPHIDPEYSRSLDALPEAERQAKKFGNWTAYEGQVFDEFRGRKYSEEPDNALHVVPSFEIPDFWPKIVAIDWGYSAMTYVLYGAISPTKRLYLYREQSFVKEKIEIWASKIKQIIDRENPREIIICHSAGQHRGEPHTILEQVSTALDRPDVRLSEKDRVAGKQRIHEFLRWQKKFVPEKEKLPYSEEFASWTLRNKGLEAYKQYLSLFDPEKEEDNLPKLQIFEELQLVISVIASVTYSKTNVEDVMEFAGDDPYDTLRYIVTAADAFFNLAEDEFKKVQKRQDLINKLESNKDWTAFYRNARAMEINDSMQPVRRFHRSRGL